MQFAAVWVFTNYLTFTKLNADLLCLMFLLVWRVSPQRARGFRFCDPFAFCWALSSPFLLYDQLLGLHFVLSGRSLLFFELNVCFDLTNVLINVVLLCCGELLEPRDESGVSCALRVRAPGWSLCCCWRAA